MIYEIADLRSLPIGTRVRGYRFDCENCGTRCIGSKATRFCCAACRIEAYRWREEAEREAEEAAAIARRELELLQRLAPDAETPEAAAEYISAHVTGDEILGMDGVTEADLSQIAVACWRHGFFIRVHQGDVTSKDDLVPLHL